jgi:hypothetical protein
MNVTAKQKGIIAGALNIAFLKKKDLYKKVLSIAGYEFDEDEESEKTAVGWMGAGIMVRELPKKAPREETAKPAGRRRLLNYQGGNTE